MCVSVCARAEMKVLRTFCGLGVGSEPVADSLQYDHGMSITADQLAEIVNRSPKTVRQWLRDTFPRPESEKNTEWVVTPDMRAAAETKWS